MGKITFVPVGGLANRMRAVASAVTLAGGLRWRFCPNYDLRTIDL